MTGRPFGYLDNPAITIELPGNVKALDGALRVAGMGPQVDEFEASMNHAVENAAPAAKQIFLNAILAMSFEDARKLLNGGDTSIINDCVVSKALDGLFYVLGQQEKEIRTKPMARTTSP